MAPYKRASEKQIELLHWVLDSGLIRDWSVAVDGGANVGDWALAMAQRFGKVHAFEPGGMFVAEHPNIVFHPKALLDKPCRVRVARNKPNNRGWYVVPHRKGGVEATTIDALNLPSCGLIKLDLEGADGLALRGARGTLRRFGPVVMIETGKQKRKRPGISDEATRSILASLGYKLRHAVYPDEVYGI